MVSGFFLSEANLQIPSPLYGCLKTKARLHLTPCSEFWIADRKSSYCDFRVSHLPNHRRGNDMDSTRLSSEYSGFMRLSRVLREGDPVYPLDSMCRGWRSTTIMHRNSACSNVIVAYKPFCTHLQEPQEGQIRKVRPDALITIQSVHMGHRCHAPSTHTMCDGPFRLD